MKKPPILYLLFLFLFYRTDAQNLKPNHSIYEIFDYQFEYYKKVRTKLFEGLADYPQIRFVVTPSFSTEYVFQIEKNPDNSYVAKLNIADKSIWYNKDFESIKLNRYSATINYNDVLLLSDAFLKIIENAHFPISIDNSISTDGTNYYFSVQDEGLKSASVHSPNDPINIDILNVIKDLTDKMKLSKEKKLELGPDNRKVLTKVNSKLSEDRKIEDYELIIKCKEFFETNQSKYLDRLSDQNKKYLKFLLNKFEKTILIEFTFNDLDIAYIEELIDNYSNHFCHYIFEDSDYNEETREQIEKTKKDNIFQQLKIVLY